MASESSAMNNPTYKHNFHFGKIQGWISFKFELFPNSD